MSDGEYESAQRIPSYKKQPRGCTDDAANQNACVTYLHRFRLDDFLRSHVGGYQVNESKHGPEVDIDVFGVAGHGPHDGKDPALATQAPLLLADQCQVDQGPAGHGLHRSVRLVPFHARQHRLHAVPRGAEGPQGAVTGRRTGQHHPFHAADGTSSQHEEAKDFLRVSGKEGYVMVWFRKIVSPSFAPALCALLPRRPSCGVRCRERSTSSPYHAGALRARCGAIHEMRTAMSRKSHIFVKH